MGETVEYRCVECGTPDRIDSSNRSFIKSLLELPDERHAELCDDCLNEKMSNTYVDFGFGHTSSPEFEAARDRRSMFGEDDDETDADAEPVTISEVVTRGFDRPHRLVDLPDRAKPAFKVLSKTITDAHYSHTHSSYVILDTDESIDALRSEMNAENIPVETVR